MNATIDKKKFIMMCIIVKDIEEAAEKWAKVLGVEKPGIIVNHLEGGDDYKYRGKPISCDLKVSCIQMDGWLLELHEVVSGESSYKEFVEKHGYGLHHIAFEVGDKREDILKGLSDEGFDVDRTVGFYPGSSWTIIDTEESMGVNLCIKPVR